MKICSECSEKQLAKGLCRRHYYAAKRASASPHDIEVYKNKPLARAAQKWANQTDEERIAYSAKYKEGIRKRREKLFDYVPNKCALSKLSKCTISNKALHRDHDHTCPCGRPRGCNDCFRGLLCNYHNAVVLPVLESLELEYIPELVKAYLKGRPLKQADFSLPTVG
jgi:hypothetical protein